MTSTAQTIADLRVHASNAPQRPAVIADGVVLTYGELEALANRFSNLFRQIGLHRGDHIACLFGNRPEVIALTWSAWRSGLYLTPLSTALTGTELSYLVDDSDALVVVADASTATIAENLLRHCQNKKVRWLSFRGTVKGFVAAEPMLAVASALPPITEPPGALMMYTSGTTGAPKGVYRPLLPASNQGSPPFAADLINLFDLGGADVRYLSTAPLYHAAPLRCALTVTAGGGTVYIMDRFDASDALDLIAHKRITHSQWVPAMFQRLLALPASKRSTFQAPDHRIAIHGAAPCPASVKNAMLSWWGPILLEYYSGSEGVGLTMISGLEAVNYPGSVGRAYKGRIHVVGDDGEELRSGERGVVYFSGTTPFQYYKSPEKTAQRTHRLGWQTFGDVGYLNDEGYLYLTDRLDDMIISGGVNIYPQEVEEVIRSIPGVYDCAVVGISDERFGERPVAFVVPDHGTGNETDTLLDRIGVECSERLGRYKRPDRIEIIDKLPRLPTGKLLRRDLREKLLNL